MDMARYNILLNLARNDQLAAYSGVAPMIGLDMSIEADRDKIAMRLGEIARYEHSNNSPMLTSLVVHYGDDINPGEGYFSIATTLGLNNGNRDPIQKLTF